MFVKMKKKLTKKIIIVTGGNGLLGKSIIANIKSEEGIPINLDINNITSSDLLNINCDVTDKKSVDNAIKLIIKKFNKIDGLVNSAYPRSDDWAEDFQQIKLSSWKNNVDMHGEHRIKIR